MTHGMAHYTTNFTSRTNSDTDRSPCCQHSSRINTSTEILATADKNRNSYCDSSCDQYLGHDRSYRSPKFDREKYNRRDFNTCSGSSESAMQEATDLNGNRTGASLISATAFTQTYKDSSTWLSYFIRESLCEVDVSRQYASVVIEKPVLHAFVDSGADVSVINKDFRMSIAPFHKKPIIIVPLTAITSDAFH